MHIRQHLPMLILGLAAITSLACDVDEGSQVADLESLESRTNYYDQPTFRALSAGSLTSRRRLNTARIGQHLLADIDLHPGGSVNGFELQNITLGNGTTVDPDSMDVVTLGDTQGALQGTSVGGGVMPWDFEGSTWSFGLRRIVNNYGFEWELDVLLSDVSKIDLLPSTGSVSIYIYTFEVHAMQWEAYREDLRILGGCNTSECERDFDCQISFDACNSGDNSENCDVLHQRCLETPIDEDPFLCDYDMFGADDGDLMNDNDPVALPDGQRGFQAVLYGDLEVDYATGDITDTDRRLNIACLSGAVGKAATWGYPAASGRVAMEAATRIIRADYCADGVPHTVDGTPVYVGDTNFSLPVDSSQNPDTWEADWGYHGAARLYNTRDGSPVDHYDSCLAPWDGVFALTDLEIF